jgi:hypothetical protein
MEETAATRVGGAAGVRRPLLHFVLLAFTFLVARHELLARWRSPIFGWRPADGGGIALNYYRNGFKLFYPQVLWGTSGNGYVEMEFPLAPYLTALLFKVFGVHEYVQLIVPFASGFGLVWLTYCWGRRYFGAMVGLVAGLLVAVSPVLIMLTNTGLWADPPMVLFATLGLYALALWTEGGSSRWLWLGVASVALAALLKLTALYIGVPIAYLFWKKYRWSSLRSPLVWLCAVGIFLPSALWYWHAHDLYVEYHNTFGIIGAGYSKFGDSHTFASPAFYGRLLRRVLLYHLTPLFTLAFLLGLYHLLKQREKLVLSWLSSIVLYVFVTAHGVDGGHYHYLLPFLPVGALISGYGVMEPLRPLARRIRQRSEWLWRAEVLAAVLIFVASVVASERRFFSRDREIDSAMWEKKKRTGLALKPLLPADALIIVVDSHMDRLSIEKSMTPPDVFYFSDHRGWYLSTAWVTVARVEELHARGASALVISGQSVEDFKARRQDMVAYLSSRYTRIMDSEDGLAFALDRPK